MLSNVKIVITLKNGIQKVIHKAAMTMEQVDNLLCYDRWNDGHTKSVYVFENGRRYADWQLRRDEHPLYV